MNVPRMRRQQDYLAKTCSQLLATTNTDTSLNVRLEHEHEFKNFIITATRI